MKTVVSFICLLAAVSVFAEKQPFERYQTIVDRQMFGPLPPGFDPTKPPSEVSRSDMSEKELTKEQEQLKSAIHFSVINVASDGQTEVGFTDNSDPKAPRHYFLKAGETSKDGKWTVKEANSESASMTIAQGEVEVTLTLGGNSATDAAATSRAGVAAAKPAEGVGRRGLLGGLSARRLRRQQAAAAESEKAAAAAAEKEAARQAQAEQEKQQREQERAEQRQQLLAIQEELKRVREEKTKTAAQAEESSDAQDDAQ